MIRIVHTSVLSMGWSVVPPKIELVGKAFGLLIVESEAEPSDSGQARWNCRCACGQTAVVLGGSLRIGGTRSCGCLRKAAKRAQHNTSIWDSQIVTIDGVDRSVLEWAKVYSLDRIVVRRRLERGWDPVKAVTTKIREYK